MDQQRQSYQNVEVVDERCRPLPHVRGRLCDMASLGRHQKSSFQQQIWWKIQLGNLNNFSAGGSGHGETVRHEGDPAYWGVPAICLTHTSLASCWEHISLKPRLHDTVGSQTGCTTGWITGCILQTNIQPVASCKRGLSIVDYAMSEQQRSVNDVNGACVTQAAGLSIGMAQLWALQGLQKRLHRSKCRLNCKFCGHEYIVH